TGASPEQTEGEGWSTILHPDDVERTVPIWQESLRTGEFYNVEYRFRRASDGQYRWHIGRAFPLRDETGQIIKWFGSCTDIHDQKCAIEERDQALERERSTRAQAETANRIKDEFLAVLSHELRAASLCRRQRLSIPFSVGQSCSRAANVTRQCAIERWILSSATPNFSPN
ncbi:PAS domain-containing protein, partial [Phormidesmis sp. 146-33]